MVLGTCWWNTRASTRCRYVAGPPRPTRRSRPVCRCIVGTLGRFPPGKALPIVKARLKVADVDESRPVAKDDKAATFTIHLPAGKTTLQTWFYDRAGKQLCGAYYVYVQKVPN